MIASTKYGDLAGTEDSALARVPARTFGETDWVTLALKNCASYLQPAIASGKPYRIAQALRAVAHAPSPEQISDTIEAACDAVLATAYSTRDSRMFANVTAARPVIDTVLAELAGATDRDTAEPAELRATVEGYLRLIQLSDKRLAMQLDTVGALAARIAATLHAPIDIARDADFAGRLSDVGMLSMPRDRGHKTHVLVGESFLASIPALAHLAPVVRSHHECYDGSGFPDGLRPEAIPLASRIIAAAAFFVECLTETSRHKAMLPHDACHELAQHAGTKFDPAVVTALLHLLHFRQQANRSA
jgi:response regulator RpfG family c-di-GMP phosphodiesterase